MTEQFKKGCDYCPAQIIMKKGVDGKWKPFEKDGFTYHKCNPRESFQDIPSNDERDKKMAPKTLSPPIPKDTARLKWEARNKKIQQKLLDEQVENIKETFGPLFKGRSEGQIMITELSKHTHLLNEINNSNTEILKELKRKKK